MAKKKKNKIPLITGSIVVIIILIWLALPVIAGMCKLGEPDGPKIYPAELHNSLYGLGHSAAGKGKPQASFFKSWLYERPWFYGMETRPIPQAQAEEMMKGTKSWFEDKYKQATD